jgi:chromosomal replication initiator protein
MEMFGRSPASILTDPRPGLVSKRPERGGTMADHVAPADRPRPAHPWDGYLIGPENALAQAGALALARGETLGISPLVIHGPAGSGKSRLLAGLVAERLLRRPESAVAHLEAEAFAAACAGASGRPGGWAEVRERFRRLDLFVLDDLQTLERTPWAMEELSHTLDALDEAGAAVAVAARSGPGQWSGWPARLVNRLVAGLSVRIEPPTVESRRRYLLDRARARGLALPAEVLEPLAEAADGYRTLEGWLAQLELSSRIERRAVAPDLVESILQGDPVEGPTLEEIARAVAGKFGLTLRDLKGSTRRAVVAEGRHLAMYLARRHTTLSFRAIGTYFGNRDPATVRHACAVAADRIASDPALLAVCSALARGWRTHA